MQSWTGPAVPQLPGSAPVLRLHDAVSGTVRPTRPAAVARMYVCGVTPYDAAHLGHAVTFLAFDLVNRVWRDAGHQVHYVQNVTDVDDPLLERAQRDGIEWTDLAVQETQRLRDDMAALRLLPPTDFVGAVESIPHIVERVRGLLDLGAAYRLDGDVYFAVDAAPRFGYVSSLDRAAMVPVFRDNGGDPDRAGKKDPLDPLLWRAERPGEPAWDSPLGRGRPGWHIECTAIALDRLGMSFDVQGGGSDLAFPHHEMSAAHAEVLTGGWPFARHYAHAGMVGLDGEKMSKSRGNLVFVHALRNEAEPAAVRLALLGRHYREDQDWSAERLTEATGRLERWRAAVKRPAAPVGATALAGLRDRLADDLDTVGALSVVDSWAAGSGDDPDAGPLVADAIDALLGVDLR